MILVVCFLEWFLYSKIYIWEVKIVVFVIMMGVGVCIVMDVYMNFIGLLVVVIVVIIMLL